MRIVIIKMIESVSDDKIGPLKSNFMLYKLFRGVDTKIAIRKINLLNIFASKYKRQPSFGLF